MKSKWIILRIIGVDHLFSFSSVLADMYDIFGDGTDYDWALYDEEV